MVSLYISTYGLIIFNNQIGYFTPKKTGKIFEIMFKNNCYMENSHFIRSGELT